MLIARDGSTRTIEAKAAPIKDDRGDATGVVLVFRDIQDRKEAEKERLELTARLAAQARIFDTALSNAADFIYTFDLEGRFTYLNHSLLTLLRKKANEAVGKNFFELGYPPDLAGRLQRQIQEVIEFRGPGQRRDAFHERSRHALLRVHFCSGARAQMARSRPLPAQPETSRSGRKWKRRRGDGPASSKGWPKSPRGSTRPTTSIRSSAS